MADKIITREIKDKDGKVIGTFVGRSEDHQKYGRNDISAALQESLKRDKEKQQRR